MIRRLPPTVDRGTVKIIAYKRTVTGILSLFGCAALLVVGLQRASGPTFMAYFAAAMFLFGGTWALRDGIRLLRELRR